MPPSAILRRVALVKTDVLEEYIASIIKVERFSELGKALNWDLTRATRRHNL
jgi:hypothetical protein